MGKFRNGIARFMYGRYGVDTLYHAIFVTALALMIINAFVGSFVISMIELLLVFWALFRFFSRNIYKRQRENRAFCGFFRKIKNWFVFRKNKFKNRKTHVFRKCPNCKNQLRLPKQKGKHTVNCPCCKNRFDVKI